MIRLQKFIAHSGVCSRRKAEGLILAGRVQVNGKTITKLGTKIDPEKDEVRVDGTPLKPPGRMVYIAFYKPRGLLSTAHDPYGRPTILDPIQKEMDDAGIPRIYHVGRLDKDSEGLLILTNDGALTHGLLHPSKKVEKTYVVTVLGVPSPKAIKRLEDGIEIHGKRTLPCRIKRIGHSGNDAVLEVKLKEGRKRQIRHMFKAIGHPVKRLVRTSIGPVRLGGLTPGRWRELSTQELKALKLQLEGS